MLKKSGGIKAINANSLPFKLPTVIVGYIAEIANLL